MATNLPRIFFGRSFRPITTSRAPVSVRLPVHCFGHSSQRPQPLRRGRGIFMTALDTLAPVPDMKVSVRQVFGIDVDLEVPAFSETDPHVPDTDPDYVFDKDTTLAILAGF